jgi:hypothetical protein
MFLYMIIFYNMEDIMILTQRYFLVKLYNDLRNAQVFNLFFYLLLPYMFWTFF